MNANPNTWTIAYRKPRANRFQRVTNWHGSWHLSTLVARAFALANPDLQVFYVPTLATEQDGACPEDAGTILVDSGKRVRMIDNGELSGAVLAYAVGLLMGDAIEENAVIDEAYQVKAEDAGMTIPAYRACLNAHTAKGEIFLSGLWTHALLSHMTKVVVFGDGSRYGVSASDASMYTGEVTDMPKGEMSTCVHCKSIVLMPEIDSPEKELDAIDTVIKVANDAIAALTPIRDHAKALFENARDNGAPDEVVGITYQAYCDAHHAIEEFQRTIMFARDV